MDAVDFIKYKDRMCNHCYSPEYSIQHKYCPIGELKGSESCADYIRKHPAKVVELVEKWAKENPVKTRQSEFLKIYPNAEVPVNDGEDNKTLRIHPCSLDINYRVEDNNGICKRYTSFGNCFECCKAYWNEEVK